MLGWFKKKFKKQEPVAPPENVVADDLNTDDALSSGYEQSENEAAQEVDTPLAIPQEQELELHETTSTPTAATEQVSDEEQEQPEHSEPSPVEAQNIVDIIDISVPKEPAKETEIDLEPEPEQEAPLDVTPAQTEKQIKTVKESDVKSQSGQKKKSLFSRLTEKLGKTRETFTYQLDALFLGKKELDADMLDDLEEILISADLGVGTTQELLENARRKVKRKELYDPKSLKETLKKQIKKLINENDQDASLVMPDKGPFVIMVIGVNGVGKTTTIGKIARKFQQAGSSVMLVAGDTFRAAAVSQLKIWGERSNVPVIAHKEGADPSSVVFDALGIAQAKNIDVVLVDTAGRMHTKDNLMEELKKIKRVMGKKMKGAPHEIMLVIDATTGQNGISQARLFDDAVGVTGITLTKLDGTSKGGIVANICRELKIPIRFIGIGEKMTDLRDFDADEFVDALFHSSHTQSEQ